MKKSDMKVTMPISAYEELMGIKTEHENLTKQLSECYDTTNFKLNPAEPIRFDYEKAEKIAKEFLPYSCKDATISF